jgi:serine/threonine-protein kinase HipA
LQQRARIARLPQEDFCQAPGVAPDRKHQSDGGPSVRDCLQVLAASEEADEGRAVFALSQLAFWLMAATDGDAKNDSIRHRRGGRFALTPPHDVRSAWPVIGAGPNRIACPRAKLALAVKGERNSHDRQREVQPHHWRRLAARCGPAVWARMRAMVDGVDGVLDAVANALPTGFPATTWEPIATGMRRHAHGLQRSTEADSGP